MVDASVGLKWYLEEADAGAARLLLRGPDELSVPHLFFTEMANVLAKRCWRRDISARVVTATLEAVEEVPLQVRPDRALLWDAVLIVLLHQISVYDGLYLALAERIDARLVTADDRLVRGLAGSGLAARLLPVGALGAGPGG